MIRNKLVVLGLLSDDPKHGYQIINTVKERNMDKWAKVSIASIYNTLISLGKDKSISKKEEKSGNMPERRVYSITSSGKKKLQELVIQGLTQVKPGENSRVTYLLSMAFINNISIKEALEALNKRKDKIEEIVSLLNDLSKVHKGNIPFNWFYIIEDFKAHRDLECKRLKKLIDTLKTKKDWQELK